MIRWIEKKISNTHTALEFAKFILVGLCNTVLTGVIYISLIYFYNVFYLWSLLISSLTGILFTYCCNFLWVFKTGKVLNFQSNFVKYIAVYGTTISANMMLLSYFTEKYSLGPIYVQFMLMPLIVIINFTGSKFWSLVPLISSQDKQTRNQGVI